MTLINKIREKSGVAVGVVAVAMGLFIVGVDLLSPNSGLLGGNKQIVGEIAGQEITLQEYNNEIEYVRSNFMMSMGGQAPTEEQMVSLRDEAWRRLIFKTAWQKEIEKLGLIVTDEEMQDMVQGNNIHPGIAASFTNPQTGQVDREQIKNYLKNLESYDPQTQFAFLNFEQNLRPDRLRTKYQDMMSRTYFATTLEAENEYFRQNSKADLSYLYINYAIVPDSAVNITDDMLRTYFNKNKSKYKRVANRAIEYVSFPVVASEQDRRQIQTELQSLMTTFANTKNDTAFIEANSDNAESIIAGNPKNLPAQLANEASLEVGKVYGPYQDANAFKIFKVISITEDDVYSARASHILFKADNETTEAKTAARNKANEILRDIQRGADFARMAEQYGTDGTRTRGGDLGWFTEGDMVTAFNDAIFAAKDTGVLNRVVETEFGYHLIKITGARTKTKYVIGMVEKQISPSDETINQVYRTAGKYARFKQKDEFVANTDKDSLIRYQALTIGKDARYINNITTPRVREVVRWAYSPETKIGSVSEVFDLESQFIIAILNEVKEDGEATLDDVREQVRAEVLKEQKAAFIIAKLKGLSGTLEEIRDAYGPGAAVFTMNDATMQAANLNRIGRAPVAIGVAFSMQTGQTSAPIKEENGVVMLHIDKMEPALETADYSSYKSQVTSNHSAMAAFYMSEAIDKYADIKDYRYKFF